jgi:hypothetical protein
MIRIFFTFTQRTMNSTGSQKALTGFPAIAHKAMT